MKTLCTILGQFSFVMESDSSLPCENINVLTASESQNKRLRDFFFSICHSPRPGERERKIAVKSARTGSKKGARATI